MYILYPRRKAGTCVSFYCLSHTCVITTATLRSTLDDDNTDMCFEGSVQLEERYINASAIPFPSLVIEKEQERPSAKDFHEQTNILEESGWQRSTRGSYFYQRVLKGAFYLHVMAGFVLSRWKMSMMGNKKDLQCICNERRYQTVQQHGSLMCFQKFLWWKLSGQSFLIGFIQ